MSVVLALAVVGVFAGLLRQLDLPRHAREVVERARGTLRVLRDESIGDREKERALRQQAVRLFTLFLTILGLGLIALGAPLATVWLLDVLGVASFREVLRVLERVDFLVVVVAVALLVQWLSKRKERS